MVVKAELRSFLGPLALFLPATIGKVLVVAAHLIRKWFEDEIVQESAFMISLEYYLNGPKAPKRVDLIKVDVEGFGYEVLASLGKKLSIVQNVVIEVEGSRKMKEINELLSSHGFTVKPFVDPAMPQTPHLHASRKPGEVSKSFRLV